MAKKKTETSKATMEWRRNYYIVHRDERLAYAKAYYKKNKEKIARKLKEKSEADPRIAAKRKAYHKKYYRRRKAEMKNNQQKGNE